MNNTYLIEKAIDLFLAEEERDGRIPMQPAFDSCSVEQVYDRKVIVLRNANGVLAAYAVDGGEHHRLTRLDEEEESKIE